MVAWTTTSQPLIGSNDQEYVPKKASMNGRQTLGWSVMKFGGILREILMGHSAQRTKHESVRQGARN